MYQIQKKENKINASNGQMDVQMRNLFNLHLTSLSSNVNTKSWSIEAGSSSDESSKIYLNRRKFYSTTILTQVGWRYHLSYVFSQNTFIFKYTYSNRAYSNCKCWYYLCKGMYHSNMSRYYFVRCLKSIDSNYYFFYYYKNKWK